MPNIPKDAVLALPLDELALRVLADLVASQEWNEWNYLNAANQQGYSSADVQAFSEALAWLRGKALIARHTQQTSHGAIIVTRSGRRVLEEGLLPLQVADRLDGLHPLISKKARPQFLLGEFEQGVFASMKAIEVRVRKLAGFGNDVIGVDLMNQAFGTKGALVDPDAQKGEQEGTRALFAGAYAVFRNPAGHREVDYDDIGEAAEAVQTASMLMRILDRIEKRIEQA
ncbi:MAG TPA: TIGR02391 family protein [Gaiellaceae bacterium]|nr:TIGR02391 family protein [Gaiellaceae bacterium]